MTIPASRLSRFTYHLNDSDEIVLVDNAWLEFAQATRAGKLLEADLIGSSVWKFIASAEVRVVYQALYEKVRRTLTPITLPFRCDGPDIRRYMSLEISLTDNHELQHTSRLLKVLPREPISWFVPTENPQAIGANTLLMCSWCCRVRVGNNWEEIETAGISLALDDASSAPAFRQGICQDCAFRVELQL